MRTRHSREWERLYIAALTWGLSDDRAREWATKEEAFQQTPRGRRARKTSERVRRAFGKATGDTP